MISSGYIGSIVSSLERYYGFSTSRLGVAFSSYDIMGVLSIPFISYIGSQNNRPRIVAFGAFLFAIGNLLFILPYLINGYEYQTNYSHSSNQSQNHFCHDNSSNSSIDSRDLCSPRSKNILLHLKENLIDEFRFPSSSSLTRQPSWTYYVVILSMIIMSIGASPFYTLGITFLTDHLNKDDQAICTSKFFFFFFFFIKNKTKQKEKRDKKSN